MTTKRNKSFPMLDRVAPAPSSYRSDPKVSNDAEALRANFDNRLTKDDIASIFSGYHNTNDSTKLATSARPTVELLRANSPTLKRLIAARAKLDKYVSSKLNTDFTTRESIDGLYETSFVSNHEKSATANIRISSSAHKRIKSQKTFSSLPLDKVTYERSAHTGNVRQKCSLEIWLPKAGADDDDNNDDEHINRVTATTTTPPLPLPILPVPTLPLPPEPTSDSKTTEKRPQSPQSSSIKSLRSSIIKTAASTITITTASTDETLSKKPEPAVIPRVYHYEDYLQYPTEERPRSSKSSNTSKSDFKTSNKTIKRHRTRQEARRLSSSTNRTDDTLQSGTSEKPMSSKNLIANIKQTSTGYEPKGTLGSGNTLMIHELMQKYSMIKRTHQELVQAKLQLEKPRQDSKITAQALKDNSLGSPFTSDTASFTSSDHLSLSVKKIVSENSPPRSAGTYNSTNTRLLERRSAYRQPAHSDILPQTRLISIVKNFHTRQTSANTSTTHLPAVIGKKNDDSIHYLERSKTLHVMFDIPIDHSNNISSPVPVPPDSPDNISDSSNLLPRKTNGVEPVSTRSPKRSIPSASTTLRPQQQQQKQQSTQPLVHLVQYQNIQNSAQRYHHSAHAPATTSVSANKALVHLKYSNSGITDRNYLLPE
ncbi:unnamed protein product [Rotaria socialis]|uniref:Uncharacterized protein n=2 Tax=Rotaria socialis TaxID=392032 RepID=A0A818IQT7_9BILA|nr:unnamed protein product [Rotaria socialis]